MTAAGARRWLATLSRFVAVGVAASLILFGLTWFFQHVGIRPFLAGAFAYAVAFAFAYTLQRNWTFGGDHGHGHALPRYLTVQAVCAAASGLFSELAVSGIGWTPLAASALTTIGASAVSFVLSSTWVFPQGARNGARRFTEN